MYIERKMDFKNPVTGEMRVDTVPDIVQHKRKRAGVLDSLSSPLAEYASGIVQRARQLAKQAAESDEVFDCDWNEPNLLTTLLGTSPSDAAGTCDTHDGPCTGRVTIAQIGSKN